MTQQPQETQLPGVPDFQVGVSDLGGHGYSWAQQAGDGQDPLSTSAHPHPLEVGARVTYENRHPSFDRQSHGDSLSISPFPDLPPTQSYGSVPTYPVPGDGHIVLPSSTLGNNSSPSFNNLRSLPSMDLSHSLTRAWPGNGYHLPSLGRETYPDPTDRTVTADSPGRRHELTDPNNEEFTPVCKFSHPCLMKPSPNGAHFRKIVSHIFGRNKSSTKLFPEWVWVWYCRRHYQRARYRAQQWPFTQCELLLQSLERMELWGQVQSFELRRRREAMQTDDQVEKPPTGQRSNGRKPPTVVAAPVPEWLQQEIGVGQSFDDIRNIINRIREHLARLKRSENSKKDTRTDSNEARTITGEQTNLHKDTANRERNSQLQFPDVEILPTSHPEVVEQARLEAAQKKRARQAEPDGEQEDVDEMDNNSEDGVEQKASGTSDTGECQGKRRKQMTTRVSGRGAIKKPLAKKASRKKT